MDQKPTPSDKKISIRKHLPLAVRIHYDAVRNFAPVKLVGFVAVALVGVLGVLLATQTVSPQSSASTNGVSSQLCAPASAPSEPNESSEYTLCSPTSLTMEQVGNQAEVNLVNAAYPPWVVGYAVGDNENCDEDFYHDVMLHVNNKIQVPGYGRGQVGFEHSYGGGWPHYQGDKSESWGVAWNQDNNKEYKFLYPIMGSGDDNDFDRAVYGKYLCITITYADNNIQFKTYKRFDLLQVEMTSKTRTDSGTTYQFASNSNAHWAQGSANGYDCDLEVDDTGQTSSSFTLEANGRDYLYRRCVKAKDANGVEASVVFFVSEADGDPTTREEVEEVEEEEEEVEEVTPDNPPVLALNQDNTALTATATDDNLNPDSWQNAGPFAADPDCESEDLTYSAAGSNQNSLTLTTADNDQWYCFRVSDTGSNTAHIKHQVTGVVVEEEVEINPQVGTILLSYDFETASQKVGVTASAGVENLEYALNSAPNLCTAAEVASTNPDFTDVVDNKVTVSDEDLTDRVYVCVRGTDTEAMIYAEQRVGEAPAPPTTGNNNTGNTNVANNNEVVSRQDAGSADLGNTDPQLASTVARTAPAESVSTGSVGDGGTDPDIPDTGLLDDQQSWFKLAGYILVGAAILGGVRVLLIKKHKQATRR